MGFFDFFSPDKKNSAANIAKDRLQIIVRERRCCDRDPRCLSDMKRDILAVICKYVQVDPNALHVQFEQKEDDVSVLELNVILPEVSSTGDFSKP
ncbi:cell division topological specificity factor MinE [Candidatus Williamhamiltonella defendens]|uniref:cell division topological specificity factor MinE n=1 Tax=Candidatus Williamhamiltonella defendens TaxID=138072 RepID=UPI0002E9AC11|nr:cell division topological specificity factor MinE [Candidatus Hamiltonella defensa]